MSSVSDAKFIGELRKGSSITLVNNDQALKYDIKIVSNPSENLPKDATNYLNGFSTDLRNLGFIDDVNETNENRIKNLEKFLEIHYLIFKIKYKTADENNRKFYNAIDIEVVRRESDKDFIFYPIPIINRDKYEVKNELEKLFNNEYINETFDISKSEDDYPSFIIINESNNNKNEINQNDELTIFGPINKLISSKEYGIKFVTENEYSHFYKINLKDLGESYLTKNLIFVSQEVDDKMIELLKKGEKILPEKNKIKVEESAELEFIEIFKTVALEKKLSYRDQDLLNFHTSMKTQGLVILSGLSGTGKSKIVHCYHEALNRFSDRIENKNIINHSNELYPKERAKLLFVPVRPFWQDDSDLLGYMDNNNGIYRPGESELIEFILEAKDNKDECYIVCLDEMNLAKVEHYFSQFLSILEKEHSENRTLNIYNSKIENRVYNSKDYPPTILLRDNLFFVGTVNIDESTFQFSDKVLDRSNVITMEVSNFNQIRNSILKFNNDNHIKNEEKSSMGIKEPLKTFSKLKSMMRNEKVNVLTDDEVNLIWNIHNLLHNANKQLGVGYRVLSQIEKYIANLPVSEIYDREMAFDYQIVQRVLTKVRGSKSQLEELLGSSNDGKYLPGSLYKLLEESNISNFDESKNTIIQLSKEIEEYGHTI